MDMTTLLIFIGTGAAALLLAWYVARRIRKSVHARDGSRQMSFHSLYVGAIGLSIFWLVLGGVLHIGSFALWAWIITMALMVAGLVYVKRGVKSRATNCINCDAIMSSNAPTCVACGCPASWNRANCKVCGVMLARNTHQSFHVTSSGSARVDLSSASGIGRITPEHKGQWFSRACPNCGEPNPIA